MLVQPVRKVAKQKKVRFRREVLVARGEGGFLRFFLGEVRLRHPKGYHVYRQQIAGWLQRFSAKGHCASVRTTQLGIFAERRAKKKKSKKISRRPDIRDPCWKSNNGGGRREIYFVALGGENMRKLWGLDRARGGVSA